MFCHGLVVGVKVMVIQLKQKRSRQMTVLVKILRFAIANGEKVAVFSQSLATLDVIGVIIIVLYTVW